MRCLKINIDNCIALKDIQSECSQCREGYFLTKNKKCIKTGNCLEFNESCLHCSDETFLFEGSCVKLKNCEK